MLSTASQWEGSLEDSDCDIDEIDVSG